MSCRRCGACCFPFSIGLDYNDDIKRWLTYHGVTVTERPDGRMAFHGQTRCGMLELKEDGTTSCAVYPDRPSVCRDFACERARQE